MHRPEPPWSSGHRTERTVGHSSVYVTGYKPAGAICPWQGERRPLQPQHLVTFTERELHSALWLQVQPGKQAVTTLPCQMGCIFPFLPQPASQTQCSGVKLLLSLAYPSQGKANRSTAARCHWAQSRAVYRMKREVPSCCGSSEHRPQSSLPTTGFLCLHMVVCGDSVPCTLGTDPREAAEDTLWSGSVLRSVHMPSGWEILAL